MADNPITLEMLRAALESERQRDLEARLRRERDMAAYDEAVRRIQWTGPGKIEYTWQKIKPHQRPPRGL